jgi:hypothetical protein
MLCTLRAAFSYGLPGGAIFLYGFVGDLLTFELGSAQEVREQTNNWFRFRLEMHRIEWTRSVEEMLRE